MMAEKKSSNNKRGKVKAKEPDEEQVHVFDGQGEHVKKTGFAGKLHKARKLVGIDKSPSSSKVKEPSTVDKDSDTSSIEGGYFSPPTTTVASTGFNTTNTTTWANWSKEHPSASSSANSSAIPVGNSRGGVNPINQPLKVVHPSPHSTPLVTTTSNTSTEVRIVNNVINLCINLPCITNS